MSEGYGYTPVTHSTQQALWSDENTSPSNDTHNAPQSLSGTPEALTAETVTIPAGAKLPQDHRKPARRKVTVQGLDLTVDLKQLQDDYELMELMAEMEGSGDEENLPLVIKLVKTVLADQYDMVKEHCREDGRVSTKRMMEVIQAVFEEVGELGE